MNKYLQKLKSGNLIETFIDYALGAVKYSDDPTIMDRYRFIISHKRKLQYYKKIKKTVLPKALERVKQMNLQQEPGEKIVWFCWFQGMENAPEVVKRCYESQQKYFCGDNDWQMKVVTDENIPKLIETPQHILDKYKKGIISRAHYSDILRLELLVRYGGCWSDSTIFCTGNGFWNYLQNVNVFLFNNWTYHTDDVKQNENYFIKANKNNPMMLLMREMLYEYWRQYDYPMHYFFWQVMFTLVAEQYPELYKKIPVVNKVNADQVTKILFEPYDEMLWNIEKYQSDIHKLSWKYPEELVTQKGTLYEYLIRQGRE